MKGSKMEKELKLTTMPLEEIKYWLDKWSRLEISTVELAGFLGVRTWKLVPNENFKHVLFTDTQIRRYIDESLSRFDLKKRTLIHDLLIESGKKKKRNLFLKRTKNIVIDHLSNETILEYITQWSNFELSIIELCGLLGVRTWRVSNKRTDKPELCTDSTLFSMMRNVVRPRIGNDVFNRIVKAHRIEVARDIGTKSAEKYKENYLNKSVTQLESFIDKYERNEISLIELFGFMGVRTWSIQPREKGCIEHLTDLNKAISKFFNKMNNKELHEKFKEAQLYREGSNLLSKYHKKVPQAKYFIKYATHEIDLHDLCFMLGIPTWRLNSNKGKFIQKIKLDDRIKEMTLENDIYECFTQFKALRRKFSQFKTNKTREIKTSTSTSSIKSSLTERDISTEEFKTALTKWGKYELSTIELAAMISIRTWKIENKQSKSIEPLSDKTVTQRLKNLAKHRKITDFYNKKSFERAKIKQTRACKQRDIENLQFVVRYYGGSNEFQTKITELLRKWESLEITTLELCGFLGIPTWSVERINANDVQIVNEGRILERIVIFMETASLLQKYQAVAKRRGDFLKIISNSKYYEDNPYERARFAVITLDNVKNGLIGPSGPSSIEEERAGISLNTIFGDTDILPQYKSKLYPFFCDFYVKSRNLYIECDFFVTHGNHAFNRDNPEDMAELNRLYEKAKTSKFYANILENWVVRDPLKIWHQRKNNLNFLRFYSVKEFNTWLMENYPDAPLI